MAVSTRRTFEHDSVLLAMLRSEALERETYQFPIPLCDQILRVPLTVMNVDVMDGLRQLADESVHCVVTSVLSAIGTYYKIKLARMGRS